MFNWINKIFGSKPKAVKKETLPIVNPIVEELVVAEELPKDMSLSEEIVIQAAVEEKAVGKKQKVTFGSKVAKFFGF